MKKFREQIESFLENDVDLLIAEVQLDSLTFSSKVVWKLDEWFPPCLHNIQPSTKPWLSLTLSTLAPFLHTLFPFLFLHYSHCSSFTIPLALRIPPPPSPLQAPLTLPTPLTLPLFPHSPLPYSLHWLPLSYSFPLFPCLLHFPHYPGTPPIPTFSLYSFPLSLYLPPHLLQFPAHFPCLPLTPPSLHVIPLLSATLPQPASTFP